jgi:hypothetical protein
VSRLAGRIARLERELGGCPVCAEQQPQIVLCGPTGNPPVAGVLACELCGEPVEQLVILLSWDPHDDEPRP